MWWIVKQRLHWQHAHEQDLSGSSPNKVNKSLLRMYSHFGQRALSCALSLVMKLYNRTMQTHGFKKMLQYLLVHIVVHTETLCWNSTRTCMHLPLKCFTKSYFTSVRQRLCLGCWRDLINKCSLDTEVLNMEFLVYKTAIPISSVGTGHSDILREIAITWIALEADFWCIYLKICRSEYKWMDL